MRQKLWCLQASAGCLSSLKPSCIFISALHIFHDIHWNEAWFTNRYNYNKSKKEPVCHIWHTKQFMHAASSQIALWLSPSLHELATRHERCSQPTMYFAWLSLGSNLGWHDQLLHRWDLAQIIDHSPLVTAESPPRRQHLSGQSCQGRTHFPTQIRSSCSQRGSQQGGDCLQTWPSLQWERCLP